MSNVVIKVENLGKRYTIGHQANKDGRTTFREALIGNARSLWKKTVDLARGKAIIQGDMQEDIWALRNVSFEIRRGEAMGIIGRNGAGKSTLLKILSRITEPTEGRVTIRGRVASLLEVGTGFHSELTGRENIYLNGTILGMTRAEIKRKFEEIVSFAEVEKYLDTPVKRYSSGMYVRLAFAVAAHLDPEILLVDEVLAVGDVQFQRKCIGKMGDVTRAGRTVLFVSHNMAAVRNFCPLALLLKSGRLQVTGPAHSVISEYENMESGSTGAEWVAADCLSTDQEVWLKKIEIVDQDHRKKNVFSSSDAILIKLTVAVNKPDENLKIGFDLTRDGMILFRSEQVDTLHSPILLTEGTHTLVCRIPPDILWEGDYGVAPLISIHLVKWILKDSDPLVRFSVAFDGSRSHFHLLITEKNHPGVIFPQLKWSKE